MSRIEFDADGEIIRKQIDVIGMLKRHKKTMAISFVVGVAAVLAAYRVVPRTYTTETIMHIGVAYFQNPLIGDMISQTSDPGELRAEREKIIKSSLDNEFANKMGEKFGLFKTPADSPGRATETEALLKRLVVTPMSGTQFKIIFKAHTAEASYGVIRGAEQRIRERMFKNRINLLAEFSSVLDGEISGADGTKRIITPGGPGDEKAQLASQIEAMEKRVASLQKLYNANHPSVQAAQEELAQMRAAQNSGSGFRLARRNSLRGDASGKEGKDGKREYSIKDDLSKQQHLINIALEIEKRDPTMSSYISLVKEPTYPASPTFPRKSIFLLLSLAVGLMSAIGSVVVLELSQRGAVHPERLSKLLQTDVLGRLQLEAPAGEKRS